MVLWIENDTTTVSPTVTLPSVVTPEIDRMITAVCVAREPKPDYLPFPCGCRADHTCDECKASFLYCIDLLYDIEGEIVDALMTAPFFVTDSFAL